MIEQRLKRTREDYDRWLGSVKTKSRVIEGSGNVFADLGIGEPDEELAKAQLASLIREAIRRRRLTQAGSFGGQNTQLGIVRGTQYSTCTGGHNTELDGLARSACEVHTPPGTPRAVKYCVPGTPHPVVRGKRGGTGLERLPA